MSDASKKDSPKGPNWAIPFFIFIALVLVSIAFDFATGYISSGLKKLANGMYDLERIKLEILPIVLIVLIIAHFVKKKNGNDHHDGHH